MKTSTLAIKSAVKVAYRRLHNFERSYNEGDTTKEFLSRDIYSLRNYIAGLSQTAETKTARDIIERFVKVCDTRLQQLVKEA